MATQRYWYLYNNNIAIVEGDQNRTVGTTTTTVDTISEALEMRINTVALAEAFGETLSMSSELPLQFHEAILFKAISMGYQDPRNFLPEQAQYFKVEYENSKREAKKYAKRHRQSGGFITPQEY